MQVDITDAGLIPGLGRSLEEGMAIHSSILTWRIPWTEEPGSLQSIGSQRLRHDWSDLAQRHAELKSCSAFALGKFAFEIRLNQCVYSVNQNR